jgi:hypothetical protein
MSTKDESYFIPSVVFSELVATTAFVHFYDEDSIFPVFGGFGYLGLAFWAVSHS